MIPDSRRSTPCERLRLQWSGCLGPSTVGIQVAATTTGSRDVSMPAACGALPVLNGAGDTDASANPVAFAFRGATKDCFDGMPGWRRGVSGRRAAGD
jgi:hypothetical protein